jgi:translation initiation factor IF-2
MAQFKPGKLLDAARPDPGCPWPDQARRGAAPWEGPAGAPRPGPAQPAGGPGRRVLATSGAAAAGPGRRVLATSGAAAAGPGRRALATSGAAAAGPGRRALASWRRFPRQLARRLSPGLRPLGCTSGRAITRPQVHPPGQSAPGGKAGGAPPVSGPPAAWMYQRAGNNTPASTSTWPECAGVRRSAPGGAAECGGWRATRRGGWHGGWRGGPRPPAGPAIREPAPAGGKGPADGYRHESRAHT